MVDIVESIDSRYEITPDPDTWEWHAMHARERVTDKLREYGICILDSNVYRAVEWFDKKTLTGGCKVFFTFSIDSPIPSSDYIEWKALTYNGYSIPRHA